LIHASKGDSKRKEGTSGSVGRRKVSVIGTAKPEQEGLDSEVPGGQDLTHRSPITPKGNLKG